MKYIKTYNESREEITSEEGKNFLDIVRQKLPEKVNKYMSLIGNKGLSAAIEDFKINDPDEVKRREKEKIKAKKENIVRLKKENKLTDYYFDFLVDKYLKTEDWKEWIKNNGYPDIGNYPTFFKARVGLKKEEYDIEYKVENPIYSLIKFKIVKYNDKINIKYSYMVRISKEGKRLFYGYLDLDYNKTELEQVIIEFIEFMKESIFITNSISFNEIKNLDIFASNLENEKYISPCKKDVKFKKISDNNEFSYLKDILLTDYYYDGEYIYLYINNKYIYKFHEQYAYKVYKLYTKAS
jgi:hypothetical protein